MSAYFDALGRYFVFRGRSSRAQFWLFYLGLVLVGILAIILDQVLGTATPEGGILLGLVSLFHLIPQLSLTVRRLHDVDRTGWWLLIGLTGVGVIVLFVFACMRGTAGPNRFGPDPADDLGLPTASGVSSARSEPSFRASSSPPILHAGFDAALNAGQEEQRKPPGTGRQTDVISELERLAELKARGSLTEAEFEVMKAQAISRVRSA